MIWGLSLSEILKRMKCDTSASPLFQFKKSFKSYRSVNTETKRHLGINFKLGTIYTNTPLRVGFSWMTPFRGAKFDGVRYAIRGWFGGVCTRMGSTYLWEWAPRGLSQVNTWFARKEWTANELIFFNNRKINCSFYYFKGVFINTLVGGLGKMEGGAEKFWVAKRGGPKSFP